MILALSFAGVAVQGKFCTKYAFDDSDVYKVIEAATYSLVWHPDAKYMDLFERAAYNAFLSGAGMSGDLFFYPNPLASSGQHQRTPWFGCACCPPNVARFIAELGGFAYRVEGNTIYVNLYGQGTANILTKAGKVKLAQTTDYPWIGDIRIDVAPEKPTGLILMVRIPGWTMGKPLPGDLYRFAAETNGQPVIRVNGEIVPLNIEKGYMPVTRTWQKSDMVEISLPMEARRVLANDNLKADAGLVAVERGPLVYCAEFPDNVGRVTPLILGDGAILTAEARPGLLNGLTVITADGAQKIMLIPYYAWAHRGRGEMGVWLPREAAKARPPAQSTIASPSM